MMANGDTDNFIHLFHTIWSAVLSAFGGFVWWNWKRMADDVRDKADKEDVKQLREELSEWLDRQEQQHKENRERLDYIIRGLPRRRDGG